MNNQPHGESTMPELTEEKPDFTETIEYLRTCVESIESISEDRWLYSSQEQKESDMELLSNQHDNFEAAITALTEYPKLLDRLERAEREAFNEGVEAVATLFEGTNAASLARSLKR